MPQTEKNHENFINDLLPLGAENGFVLDSKGNHLCGVTGAYLSDEIDAEVARMIAESFNAAHAEQIIGAKLLTLPVSEITFEKGLAALLNYFDKDSATNTPDFVLAQFLCGALAAYADAVKADAACHNSVVEKLKVTPGIARPYPPLGTRPPDPPRPARRIDYA